MRYLTSLLIVVWSCWAYAQPSLLSILEKEYQQQLLDQLPGEPEGLLSLEEALPCPACPQEENLRPAPFAPIVALRGTEVELRDSTVCYRYDPYAQEWGLSSKAVYSYDEDHRETELIGYTWQDGWKFDYRLIQAYNETGMVVEYTFQRWGDTDWENQYRYQYSYNEAEQRTESLYQLWEESLGGWQDNNRHIYSYDEQGRLEEDLLLSDRDYPSGALTPLNKSIYDYADSNDPVSVTAYQLSGPATQEWVLYSRTLYDYYAPGTVLEALRQLWTGSEWRDNGRTYYAFDENGYLIERGQQFWQGTGAWLNYSRYLYENDAVGNVLKRTHQTWNVFTEDWQNSYEYTYTYDERNRETENYIRDWGATAYTWQSDYVGIIQYDEAGNELEVLIQYWDEEAGALVNSYRAIQAFDSQGNLLSMTLQYWEEGNWLNEQLFTYEYDEWGQAVRKQEYYWDEETGTWSAYIEWVFEYQDGLLTLETNLYVETSGDTIYIERSLYTYDERDSLTETLSQFIDSDTEEWINTYRCLISYNTSGLRSDSLRQRWLLDEWTNYSRVVYTYDDAGRLTEQLEQDWQSFNYEWRNDYLNTWTFNDDGLITEHVGMQWFNFYDGARWENEYRELFAYDDAGREVSYTYQTWDGNYLRWQYRYRYFNAYDEATGLLLERIVEEYNTLSNDWEFDSRGLYEYNEQGQLTFLDVQSATPTEYGWLDFSHCQSYWRTIVPVPEAKPVSIRCITANPYTSGSPIVFEGLDASRRYEFRLTGLWGRTLFREVIEGGKALQVNTDLPPGLYLLTLHNENGMIYRQKLIIHSVK